MQKNIFRKTFSLTTLFASQPASVKIGNHLITLMGIKDPRKIF